MEYKIIENKIVLKMSKGESVIASLKGLLSKEEVKFATIEAIGAIKEVTLGTLLEDGSYSNKLFKDDYELISLKGSIAGDNEIHMHASMCGHDFKMIGGHFFDATVNGVIEMVITRVGDKKINKLQKKVDPFPTWDLDNKLSFD